MPYRSLIKYVFMAKRCGWYTTKRHMLKASVSPSDIAFVLCCLLRLLGIQEEKKKITESA